MLKDLREAYKAEVALVKPIRQKIQTTREWERYHAWNEKRSRGEVRRHLHLAACYVRGTSYRKCEANPEENPSAERIQGILSEFGCKESADHPVAAWLDIPPVKEERPPRAERLYTVVRADLPPGPQGVQSAHAMREFASKYPEIEKAWHKRSNTLAFLSVPDEAALIRLRQGLPSWVCVVEFREPDLGDSLTAICVEPKGGRFLRGLAPMLAPAQADAA